MYLSLLSFGEVDWKHIISYYAQLMGRTEDGRREILGLEQIHFLRSQDLGATSEIKDRAWLGLDVPEEAPHTWTALMDDNPISLSFIENGKMLGYSYNFLKFMHDEIVLWVHMVGVLPEYQNLHVGEKLMRGNFEFVRNSKLGELVQSVSLTSDPLVSRNMYFFLHKCGMFAREFAQDVYAQEGRSIPSDRLVFVKHPTISDTFRYPTPEDYQNIYVSFPRAFLKIDEQAIIDIPVDLPMVFVETPPDSSHADNLGFEKGVEWREFHRGCNPPLFQNGYYVVDLTRIEFSGMTRSFIVLMKGFNETDSDTVLKCASTLI